MPDTVERPSNEDYLRLECELNSPPLSHRCKNCE